MSTGYLGLLNVCQLVTLAYWLSVNWLPWSADCLPIGYIGALTVCQPVTLDY